MIVLDDILRDSGSRYAVATGCVTSRSEIDAFLLSLRQRRKFAKTTHHSWAALLADGGPLKNDDGEAGAGAVIEHMMATRLYQNTARVHFNQHAEQAGRFGRRLIYGGYIIGLAGALSFNGQANGFLVTAINGGRHVNPTFAGDTVYAWSEVIDKLVLPGRNDLGALRLRTVATKDRPCADFPYQTSDGRYDPSAFSTSITRS